MAPPARAWRGLPALRSPATNYIVAVGLATAGSAFGLLGATGITTAAGARSHGAIFSGVFMAIYLLAAGVATPYTPRVCHRFDTRTAFAGTQALGAVLWLLTGVALLLGAPPMPTLLAAAVPLGLVAGLSAVLRPIMAKSYLGAGNTAQAFAWMSVSTGMAWAAGALLGGWLLSAVALEWGLIIAGALSVALARTAHQVAPVVEPARPAVVARPWHEARWALQGSAVLRWSAALGAVAMLFLAPTTSLVVPIAQALGHTPNVTSAGYLMAAFSIGELCSPPVVRRMRSRRPDVPAACRATVLAGATLVVLAGASALLARRIELAAWVVIGIAFGALRFSAKAFYVGAAAESGPPGDATRNLAAATLIGLLAAPLGTLACSALIGGLSAEAAVLLSGFGAIVAGLVMNQLQRAGPTTGPPTGA